MKNKIFAAFLGLIVLFCFIGCKAQNNASDTKCYLEPSVSNEKFARFAGPVTLERIDVAKAELFNGTTLLGKFESTEEKMALEQLAESKFEVSLGENNFTLNLFNLSGEIILSSTKAAVMQEGKNKVVFEMVIPPGKGSLKILTEGYTEKAVVEVYRIEDNELKKISSEIVTNVHGQIIYEKEIDNDFYYVVVRDARDTKKIIYQDTVSVETGRNTTYGTIRVYVEKQFEFTGTDNNDYKIEYLSDGSVKYYKNSILQDEGEFEEETKTLLGKAVCITDINAADDELLVTFENTDKEKRAVVSLSLNSGKPTVKEGSADGWLSVPVTFKYKTSDDGVHFTEDKSYAWPIMRLTPEELLSTSLKTAISVPANIVDAKLSEGKLILKPLAAGTTIVSVVNSEDITVKLTVQVNEKGYFDIVKKFLPRTKEITPEEIGFTVINSCTPESVIPFNATVDSSTNKLKIKAKKDGKEIITVNGKDSNDETYDKYLRFTVNDEGYTSYEVLANPLMNVVLPVQDHTNFIVNFVQHTQNEAKKIYDYTYYVEFYVEDQKIEDASFDWYVDGSLIYGVNSNSYKLNSNELDGGNHLFMVTTEYGGRTYSINFNVECFTEMETFCPYSVNVTYVNEWNQTVTEKWYSWENFSMESSYEEGYDVFTGDNAYQYIDDNGESYLRSFSDVKETVTAIETIGFVEIATDALADFPNLVKVTFDNSMSIIDENAFEGSKKLERIEMPYSLIDIHENAFVDCKSLKSIVVDIANPVYVVTDNILYTKDMKTLVVYPSGLGNEEFTIPSTVKNIYSGAFAYANKLKKINLDHNLVYVGEGCFGFTGIEEFTYDKNWGLNIPNYFLYYCENLKSVTICEGINSIGEKAFYGCPLEELTVKGNKYVDFDFDIISEKYVDESTGTVIEPGVDFENFVFTVPVIMYGELADYLGYPEFLKMDIPPREPVTEWNDQIIGYVDQMGIASIELHKVPLPDGVTLERLRLYLPLFGEERIYINMTEEEWEEYMEAMQEAGEPYVDIMPLSEIIDEIFSIYIETGMPEITGNLMENMFLMYSLFLDKITNTLYYMPVEYLNDPMYEDFLIEVEIEFSDGYIIEYSGLYPLS